jgi:protein-disulfide isomerase
MSKLLKSTILLSSVLAASIYGSDVSKIEDYLTDQLEKSPAVKEGDVQVIDEKKLKEVPGWNAYIVSLEATLKKGNKKIHQKGIFFSNGTYITSDMTNLQTGESLKIKVKPKFQQKHYTKANLIAGEENASHKIAIFSDPLCPFCRQYVPKTLKELQKDPKKFAVYYYHLPLPNIHPASVVLVKALIAAELKGEKVDLLKLYTLIQPDSPKKPHYVAYREKDVKKILKVFNEVMGTHVTPKDLQSPEVIARMKNDEKIAEDLMVMGTPTLYVDGEYDRTKRKYKTVK